MRGRESILQEHCVNWFRYQYPHFKYLLFAIPNGGQRNKATGAILKKEGVLTGVADLFFSKPRMQKNYPAHGLYIEMKTGTNTQTQAQKRFEHSVKALGYHYVVCRSLEEFMQTIQLYLSTDGPERGKQKA